MLNDETGGSKKKSTKFEVNFIVRDRSGKATPKRKTFASNSAEDMSNFFDKHTQKNKGKGRKGKKGRKPSSGGNSS